MRKIMYSIGLITTIGISLGATFKILHMPGGEQLFNYSFLGFLLIYVPMTSIDRYKQNGCKTLSEKLRIGLAFSSSITIGFAVLFKMLHLQGVDELLLVGMGMFSFGFLPLLFFTMYKKSIS
ncbi:MAG: hypothetical protein JJE09_09295 [Bacteroidia bacterium]|nr:hypothetical protein [Bacteroidia bacterium]